MTQEVYHIPALLPEALAALDIREDGIYVDATLGGGGHSRAIVERLSPEGHLYSFDQDSDAIERAFSDPRFTAVYGNFRFLSNFLRYYGVEKADGVLADLGVSSHHFDDPERGFSFRADARLDMRMNRRAGLSAAKFLEEASEDRIADVLRFFGELRQARRMARAIVGARKGGGVDTTARLVEAVRPFINPRQEKKELAQVFQALRIEVNGEMDALKSFLEQSLRVLRPGGRLAVITYHSLEDRLVKNFMRSGRIDGEVEKDLYGRANVPFRLLTAKPVVPSEEEVARNPRSRSAKLRVAERLDNGSAD